VENPPTGPVRRILQACLAAGVVGAVTFVAFKVVKVNSTTVALLLLLAVLAIAARWGLLESLIASFAGMLCFNFFFLPPIGKWTIADPQNWVALLAFVVTAVVASQLSARAKRRAAEATSRQHEMERLYALSRSLMLMDAQSPFAEQIARQIAGVFGFKNVLFYDADTDEIHRAGPGKALVNEDLLRESAVRGAMLADTGANITVLPVTIGGRSVGSVALPSSPASGTALHAIAQLTAIALERALGQEATSRADAVRQSEELKSVMLDALAHEFKTPLTSIKAAVTSLLNEDSTGPPHRELLEIVDEESDRLTSLVTEAIQMARIEAGQMELRKAPQSIADLIRETLSKLAGSLESRPIEVLVSGDLPPVVADPELLRTVIRQLVDNAAKYSPPGSPISIHAEQEGDSIVVRVADHGPGLAEADRKRVFEKFYRGRDARERMPGTGMGLAIAREIIRAHNGDMRVESRLGRGSEFLFSLPVVNQETTS